MTPTMAGVRVSGDEAASATLADQGPFGPPLGEPLDGPMATAGLPWWHSADDRVRTGLWSCTGGRFHTAFGGDEGEFIWVVSGSLTCAEDGGPTTALAPGNAMLFPPGWSGEWQISGTLRKVFAGWTGGVAGEGRGAGAALSHPRIDMAEASAIALEPQGAVPAERTGGGPLAYRGRELWRSANGMLEAGVWEIDAGRFGADFGGYGELIRIVSGEVECTPDDGGPQFVLRPGDWATFQRGWTGEWRMRAPLRKIYLNWAVH
jgi:uncharacterized protein